MHFMNVSNLFVLEEFSIKTKLQLILNNVLPADSFFNFS